MKEKYFLTVKLVTNTGGSVNTLYIEKNLCDGDKVIGRYRNIIVTRLNNSTVHEIYQFSVVGRVFIMIYNT